VQKDAAISAALNKLILDYYKEDILAAKECLGLHEKLNTTGKSLVRRQGFSEAKKS